MSVFRSVRSERAAVTWWVDDVAMTERERVAQGTYGPNPARTVEQFYAMYVFDELIQNRDRNQGNMLWTSDWKLWLIDHTRAFRPQVENRPTGKADANQPAPARESAAPESGRHRGRNGGTI